MTPQELESRILDWARRQNDIEALVQFGSRVLGAGKFDVLSDWDFHLITNRPRQFYCTDWVKAIAPPWCVHVERSMRGVMKVSVVFEGGLEVDFVLLVAWQMKLVFWGMRHPEWKKWMPSVLRRGILETRVILLGSGYKVIAGGSAWEKRLSALRVAWGSRRMSAEEFNWHAAAFWQKSVWVAKKILRPELRSAMHWLHKLVIEHVYALLEEEAWLAGRVARPQALKAEHWLGNTRLAQTEIKTSNDQRVLAQALLSQLTLFDEVSRSIAESRGFGMPDYSSVAAWLRKELTKLIDEA